MPFDGFAELERNGWSDDAIAAGYIDLFAPASDLAIPELVAGIPAGARVLDACCGQGNVTEALAERGHEVVAVDFSPVMLAHARRRVAGVEFVEADVQELPFDDAEFGAAVCNFGLVHVPDQPRALREIRRVLKRGARFAMTAWCGPEVSPTFQILYGSVRQHGDPGVVMPDGPNFHQFADPALARALFEEAGFALQSQQQVDCHWTLDSPEELPEIFRRGAPRGGYLLTRQPEAARRAIEAAIAAQVRERFAVQDCWHVPVPAALTRGVAA